MLFQDGDDHRGSRAFQQALDGGVLQTGSDLGLSGQNRAEVNGAARFRAVDSVGSQAHKVLVLV